MANGAVNIMEKGQKIISMVGDTVYSIEEHNGSIVCVSVPSLMNAGKWRQDLLHTEMVHDISIEIICHDTPIWESIRIMNYLTEGEWK